MHHIYGKFFVGGIYHQFNIVILLIVVELNDLLSRVSRKHGAIALKTMHIMRQYPLTK